jgi:hypothetical protein
MDVIGQPIGHDQRRRQGESQRDWQGCEEQNALSSFSPRMLHT